MCRIKAAGMLVDIPPEEEEALGDMLSHSYATLEDAISAAYGEYVEAASKFISMPCDLDIYQKVKVLGTRMHEVPGFNRAIPWCYFVITDRGRIHILH